MAVDSSAPASATENSKVTTKKAQVLAFIGDN
jgi:hypothetical protein